jgi:uncharacterized protein (TIGR00255 family)
MTGYAQVKAAAGEQRGFTLTLKAVNHRYLDLHFRMPADTEALELKLRQALKEKLARGHVDVLVTLDEAAGGIGINREVVGGYVQAFRAAAQEFGVTGEPDLNQALRLPGAFAAGPGATQNGDFDPAVLEALEQAVKRLDSMREAEGASIARELRERIERMGKAAAEVERLRPIIVRAQLERMQAKLKELLGNLADQNRILQEAAMLAERSDVQEEVVRMKSHCEHFLALVAAGGEVGKKLDFLLQEMNREANTMLSKTAGIAGDGLRITELGLEMKSEIEKAREQVQNLE